MSKAGRKNDDCEKSQVSENQDNNKQDTAILGILAVNKTLDRSLAGKSGVWFRVQNTIPKRRIDSYATSGSIASSKKILLTCCGHSPA